MTTTSLAAKSPKKFSDVNPFHPTRRWQIFSYVILVFWAFVVLFPLYWLAITAFKQPIDVSSGPKFLPFVDYKPTLSAWNDMLFTQGTSVTRPFFNTLIVGLNSSIIVIILGACASYALNRFEYHPKPGLILVGAGCVFLAIVIASQGLHWTIAVAIAIAVFLVLAQTIGKRFKGTMGNSDIAFWLISQRMLPPVVVIIPIYVIFQQLHLLNTLTALIIAYTAANIPLAVWFLRDYFGTIPIELEESAFIDGATRWQVLARIVLPLSLPGLVATFLIVLVFTWNEFLIGLFLSGADTQTMPVMLVGQNATRGPQWWNISVMVMLMITPIVILAIILERYIAKGILVGAVKG
jgi:multiple sugar transport system permease protein